MCVKIIVELIIYSLILRARSHRTKTDLKTKNIKDQECIQVGCVPFAAVAVSPAMDASCHVHPPAAHATCHAYPLPCMPPTYAPCHAHLLPRTPPAMHAPPPPHACENIKI